jgi:hypothetical protein
MRQSFSGEGLPHGGVPWVGGKRMNPALFQSFIYIDEGDKKIFKI